MVELGKIGQILDERRDEVVAGGEAGRLDPLERGLADRWIDGAHRVDEPVREADSIVVRRSRSSANPSDVRALTPAHWASSTDLPAPGGAMSRTTRCCASVVEPPDQMVATDRRCRDGRLCRPDRAVRSHHPRFAQHANWTGPLRTCDGMSS